MTDTTSGEVLACVSYPGYDNNRLANTMDSNYYNKLVTNQARPFYNNATQEKTAPGYYLQAYGGRGRPDGRRD